MLAGFMIIALLMAFASATMAIILGFTIYGVILAYMFGGAASLLAGLAATAIAATRGTPEPSMSVRTGETA